MGQEECNETIRKGPWTEHEDVQLVFYVNMFGDRRWDFIAKVSGLKRNGKSCRLRWVNYLHPSLKRGKMAPHEERLVLELHSKWGNRWSKIAQKLPGRTDNEIKNYWRTHMRKKAQEEKRTTCSSSSPSLSNSSSSSSISSCNNPMFDVMTNDQTIKSSFYDTGGIEMVAITKGININKNNNKNRVTSVKSIIREEDECYSMDEIWKDIDLLEDDGKKSVFDPYSKILDYSWMMDDQNEFDSRFFFQQASNFMNN